MPMRFVHLTPWMVAAAVAGQGCGNGPMSTGKDAGTEAGTGGSDAGNSCAQCGPAATPGWDGPLLAWIGAQTEAPSCPPGAPSDGYEGHADLNAAINCATCTCTPPTGSCSLPKTMTANAATCALTTGSTPHTPFDPASGWTGACDTSNAIPSGKLCSGVDCVQSLTIGPLAVNDTGGCTPSPPPPQSTPVWQTFVRVCQEVPLIGCNHGAGACLPASPPGFRVCIFQSGDNDCVPPTPYTDKFVFYENYQDTRACSGCTCGSATGSACSSTITIFTDGACSALAYSAAIDATGPACHDLPAGTPLGSKSATAPTYTPGSCAPDGGVPSGAATPTGPSTLCCIPAP